MQRSKNICTYGDLTPAVMLPFSKPPEGKARYDMGINRGIHVNEDYDPSNRTWIAVLGHEIVHSIQTQWVTSPMDTLKHQLRLFLDTLLSPGFNPYSNSETIEGEATDIQELIEEFLITPVPNEEPGTWVYDLICRDNRCKHDQSLVIKKGNFF